MKAHNIILSGGGTGGHVFPAIAIAKAIQAIEPSAKFLFVGAKGKIEMEKVPAAGFEIVGLDIQGIQRSLSLKNLLLPLKLLKSLWDAYRIIKKFKPTAAVGVGGYASGPLLFMARWMNIPYLIQEQNSYAGVTNKLLGKAAQKIAVAYEGMERYFPSSKILLTGNPVRSNFSHIHEQKAAALAHFGLSAERKVIFITGGSLGARTLNESVLEHLDFIRSAEIQVIWQTGRFYYSTIVEKEENYYPKGFRIFEFVSNMDMAYAAADLIISRAGAGTISELCLVKKPVILVPSPNVAENHQYKNAEALLKKNAALLIKDELAREELIPRAVKLLADEKKCNELSEAISQLGMPNAAIEIAKEILIISK